MWACRSKQTFVGLPTHRCLGFCRRFSAQTHSAFAAREKDTLRCAALPVRNLLRAGFSGSMARGVQTCPAVLRDTRDKPKAKPALGLPHDKCECFCEEITPGDKSDVVQLDNITRWQSRRRLRPGGRYRCRWSLESCTMCHRLLRESRTHQCKVAACQMPVVVTSGRRLNSGLCAPW